MRRAAPLAALLLLGACAATPASEAPPAEAPPAEAPLGGTRWQLVELRAAGLFAAPMRIAEPARYTLDFEPGGAVVARLDCNRGRGSWEGSALWGDSGALRLSPMVVTRALCPADSIGDLLARVLLEVRRYQISGEELRLAPATGAARIVWQRAQP